MHGNDVPSGHTHSVDEPCPIALDGFWKGTFTNCCRLRGKIAARELEALGEEELAHEMFSDMTCDEALAFREKLVAAVVVLEERHTNSDNKPHGAGRDGTFDREQNRWNSYSTFEEALDSILEAAEWYYQVGSRGFGVDAWY